MAGALALGLSVLASLLVAPTAATAATATNNPAFTANVMAPLVVTDWPQFEAQLQTVKNYGVDAVSADIWWGTVEGAADNQFNWSYYDTLFQKITAKGLKIVPIFSFHQCGGNVGDTCNIPLPSWLWSKYNGQTLNGVTLDVNGLKHRSEQGNFSSETVQGWADLLVQNEYTAFTAAFTARYGATYASSLQEINVSLGPAGELRYPSYNGHDSGSGYPTRGALQSYSPLAVKSFQQFAVAKYTTLAGVNAAWGSAVTTQAQIQPPSNASFFFSSGDYRSTQYGKDFIDWYNGSLVDHGERMLDTVIAALGTSFPGAKVGYKIPGVHWSMTGPTPRAAEVASGLVRTSVDMAAANTGRGYANIVGLANRVADSGRSIVLHFTCLEFSNEDYAPQYSQAKSLVGWLGAEAGRQGIAIKGENALSGGATSDAGWNNVNDAFDNFPYVGMTVLRVGEVASGTGATRYAQFIQKYRGSAWSALYIRGTNNNWATTTPMTKSGNVWTATNVSFGAAANQRFKFDVTGDWSTNYGGTGLTGTAALAGADIAVASNTTYTITFNEATKQYTATPTTPAATFNVSGTVTGAAVSGVTITAGTKTATTDAAGQYTLTGLPNGVYTITATKAGSTFTPATRSATVASANLTAQNFVSTVPQAQSVTIKFAEWQSASSYSIHTWNGLSGTVPMTYEGFFNNRHWWTVTLTNVPSTFGFTFTNSNGNWDTADRAFSQQGATLFVLSGSATVSTTRP